MGPAPRNFAADPYAEEVENPDRQHQVEQDAAYAHELHQQEQQEAQPFAEAGGVKGPPERVCAVLRWEAVGRQESPDPDQRKSSRWSKRTSRKDVSGVEVGGCR